MRSLAKRLSVHSSSGQLPGQGMVEYALIISFVALVVIGALFVLGPKISNFFMMAGNSLPY